MAFLSLGAAFSPTLVLYARDAGASPAAVGGPIALGSFLGSLIRLPAGALSTFAGRRKLLLAGTAALAAVPLLPLLLPPSLPLLWTVGGLYALATIFMPAALAYVHDLFPESDQARPLGFYTAFTGLGRAAGPLAAGFLLERLGSRSGPGRYAPVYLLCAAAGTASFLLMRGLPEAGRPGPDPDPFARRVLRDLGAALSDRPLAGAYVARLVQTLALGAMIAFFPVYGREVAGLTESRIGLLLSALHVMAVLTRPATAVLSSGVRRTPFMAAGMVTVAAALLLVPRTTRFWALLPLLALMGMGEAVGQVSTLAYLADRAGKRLFGAAAGIVGTFFDLGLAAGQFLPGILLPIFGSPPHYAAGYPPAFGILGAAILAAGLAIPRFLHSFERNRPAGETPSQH